MSETAAYTSWIASKYATSWQVGLLLVVNYVTTGFLVPEDNAFSNGVSSHLLDFIWSAGMAATLLMFDFVYLRAQPRRLAQNFLAWVCSAAVANSVVITVVSVVSGRGASQAYVIGVLWGTTSLLGAALSFTLVVAGFREGRALSRSLKNTQRELRGTRESAVETLSQYAQQLREPLRSLVEGIRVSVSPLIVEGSRTVDASESVRGFIVSDLPKTIGTLQTTKARQSQRVVSKARLNNGRELLRVPVKSSISLVGLYSITILFSARLVTRFRGSQVSWGCRWHWRALPRFSWFGLQSLGHERFLGRRSV